MPRVSFDPLDGTPIIDGKRLRQDGTSGGSPIYRSDQHGVAITISHIHPDGAARGDIRISFQGIPPSRAGRLDFELAPDAMANLERFAESQNANITFAGTDPRSRLRVSVEPGPELMARLSSGDIAVIDRDTVQDRYRLRLGAESRVDFAVGEGLGFSFVGDGRVFNLAPSFTSAIRHDWSPAKIQAEIQSEFRSAFEGPPVTGGPAPVAPALPKPP